MGAPPLLGRTPWTPRADRAPAPQVRAAAALYLAANPGTSPAAVEDALEANTEDVNNVSVHPEELLDVRAL